MNKITLLFSFIFTVYSYSQIDSIKIYNSSLDPVTVRVENLSGEQIYTRTKDYIYKTFKNPDKVIKVDQLNKSVRIDGINQFTYKSPIGKRVNDYTFSLSIDFKEGRYRVLFSEINLYINNRLYDLNYFYKKEGEFKKNKEIAAMRTALMNSVNDTHFLLYNYILYAEDLDDW